MQEKQNKSTKHKRPQEKKDKKKKERQKHRLCGRGGCNMYTSSVLQYNMLSGHLVYILQVFCIPPL